MFPPKQIRRQTHRVPAPRAAVSTREKLVQAAGHVFSEHGYQATTVREIVKRSDANIAAVNYPFGDKLGLYTEVLQQSVRAARVDIINLALDQNASPEEILRAVIRTRLQSVAEHILRGGLWNHGRSDDPEPSRRDAGGGPRWLSAGVSAVRAWNGNLGADLLDADFWVRMIYG
jgi:AcrR family transcriptional regulator